jgi:hypothetical protein
MIAFIWKMVSIWSLYETARYVIILLVRGEIALYANTRSNCRRCQFRIFCARLALNVQSRIGTDSPRKVRIGIAVIGIAAVLGNLDIVSLVLRKLLEQRRKINVRQKSFMSRFRL